MSFFKIAVTIVRSLAVIVPIRLRMSDSEIAVRRSTPIAHMNGSPAFFEIGH